MTRFIDRCVIVTGRVAASAAPPNRRFAAEGAKVAVFDLNLGVAEPWPPPSAENGQARAFACDIADRAEVDAAWPRRSRAFGPIDVLVNNAGWDVFAPFLEDRARRWAKLIAINLTGALHMHHAVLPGMIARRAGRIVNIASDAARVGSSGGRCMLACKGRAGGVLQTIAREHARHGITSTWSAPAPPTPPCSTATSRRRQPREAARGLHPSIPAGPHRPA